MPEARSEKVTFDGSQGHELAARLDLPAGTPRAYALFAHCFTCSKDVFAAARISRELAERGIAVLRFDFTGLGSSEGEFENTNFSSNVEDLKRAAAFLEAEYAAPQILVGHSLGGAAVLAAAPDIPGAQAVATIGAPADPAHVAEHFQDRHAEIETEGEAEVCLGGRPFRITQQFLEDIGEQTLKDAIGGLKRPLLVMHGPLDTVVGIDNATRIFQAAMHPKSFVSLDDADHLLSRRADAVYAAEVIAAWATRYVEDAVQAADRPTLEAEPGTVVVAETGGGKFAQAVSVNGVHHMLADEPVDSGGTDTGPSPYDFLMAGLGACTAMTLRMYADHKQLPLEHVSVTLSHGKIHAEDCEDCETRKGKIDRIERRIRITGDLDEATRERLLQIADKCPVHRTLHSEVKIVSELEG